MDVRRPAYFDLETVGILKETLENAWASLRARSAWQHDTDLLAERILRAAADGERDRERLFDAALVKLLIQQFCGRF
jgi:hypothetical protein